MIALYNMTKHMIGQKLLKYKQISVTKKKTNLTNK